MSAIFSDGANIFFGKNGAGKSNLLEAIFLTLLGKSPRGARDAVMVAEGANFYRVEGEVRTGKQTQSVAIAYDTGGRKKITIDKTPSRNSGLFERFSAVSFGPTDLEILSGPPSKRREYINIYLSQASAKHLSYLSDYHKALEQRNAFLRQNEYGGANPYDEMVIELGSQITLQRKLFLEIISGDAGEYHANISDGQNLKTAYTPSVELNDDFGDIKLIKLQFEKTIGRLKEREKILQTSLVGPHRDDIDFYINGRPARTHASQGEMRTAAIALKLAVFDYLKRIQKISPLLLLDEIFAELDISRRRKLIDSFGQFEQLFLTTATDIPELASNERKKFVIENNSINPE